MNSWGPGHNTTPPVTVRRGGRYWFGVVAVMLFVSPSLLRTTTGTAADGQTSWTVLAMVTVAALALGVGEARGRKRFAAGRPLLFLVAALVAFVSAWGLPAFGYAAGFYGWPRAARAWSRRNARAGRAARPRTLTRRASGPAALPAIAGGYFGTGDNGRAVVASARGAALVIGPPGSGKTQGVIMPSVAFAPAAVVSTSIKTEVLAHTLTARQQRGRCWLFDPGGAETPPPGVTALRWNPLCDVRDWDTARSVAARLAGPARAGAGADLGGGDHWVDRAESWLAVLLLAAKMATPGGDLAALARWCIAPTAAGPDAEAVLIVAQDDDAEGVEMAAAVLQSLLSIPDKERESIGSTLGRIMSIYTSTAALRAGLDPNFDVAEFVRGADTVYITAPVDRQRDYAPLIAGFLESVRLAQYHRRQVVDLGGETQDAPITFVLDEAANTAPIPLPNIASEAGGQGLHLVVAFQDLSQARARWGRAADGFLTLFPEKLVLSGMADRNTAEMLSRMSGEYDRMTIGVSTPGRTRGRGGVSRSEPGYTYNTTRTPVLSVADITGVPPGRGLYWSPRGWQLLAINPWWKQRTAYGL